MEQKKQRQATYATSIAASAASMIAKFVCHPIDTVKAKVQVNRQKIQNISDAKIGKALEIAKKTFQNQGIKGFFRGVSISVIGSSIAFSFYMSAYEYSKKKLTERKFFSQNPFVAHLLSGFFAEIISCSLWLPIDIIKQRLQVQSQIKIYNYKGPRDAMSKINISEGLIGLYRAFGATLLFFGPFSALFFTFYQQMKSWVIQDKPTLIQSIICSSTASGLAGFLTTPLQIVKLRMQIQRADVASHGGTLQNSVFGYKNAFHGLYLMVKNEGAYSLYRGAILRMFLTVPVVTLSMSLTQLFKHRLIDSHLLQPFI